jgi:hypothetical protein
MLNPRTVSLLALLWLAPAAPAAQRAHPAPGQIHAPFERLADSGPRGAVTLAFDAKDHARFAAAHRTGTPLRLTGLPLPGGLELELALRPVQALAQGAAALSILPDGTRRRVEASVATFAGSARVPGSRAVGPAFLGISPTQLHGYLVLAGETYFLSSGGQARGRATLAHPARLGRLPAGFCALGTSAPAAPGEPPQRLTSGPTVRVAEVFVEADAAYRGLFASDQDCVDYSALLLAATSAIYRRDLGIELVIPDGYLRVWNVTAPWGVISSFSDIGNVQAWWTSLANPDRDLPRGTVHVLTTPVFGGVAWNVGGLCDHSQGYEVSSVFGSFPYPVEHTDDANWDLFVVCHEYGHSFGSIHSFDFSPPITCTDGSGPDMGTIMSYCHLDFGVGGVGMRFHQREQELMLAYTDTVTCLGDIPIARGDYDHDGDRDFTDLAAADDVLAQGFVSLGASATFDLDADGDFDAVDRDLLAAIVSGAPPASALVRNGSGLNPSCYFPLSNPVLGGTWSTQILAVGAGRPTLIVAYDLPSSGIFLPYGELLVATPGLGGTFLLRHAAPSSGVFADHALSVPIDPALAGLSAATQGITLGGPSGPELCNAIDLVLSPYE